MSGAYMKARDYFPERREWQSQRSLIGLELAMFVILQDFLKNMSDFYHKSM